LVGGTHYYLQSLLWKQSLVSSKHDASDEEVKVDPSPEIPTSVLYERLKEVDPIMAERWHPNDRRKILRSLQVSK
jgi:tRNA dimethylallyltransferase